MLDQTPSDTPQYDDGAQPTALSVEGKITKKELKPITRAMRNGTFGPTSVYYAGVTAPAIAAAMSTIVMATLNRAGWSAIWVLIISGIVTSMAGISWYLVFMRLSYRHGLGRSSESIETTKIQIDDLGVFWARGSAKTRIDWAGISNIEVNRKFIHIHVDDAEDLFLPKAWFEDRKGMRAFGQKLRAMRKEYSV